jgi:hypothetical protein
VVFNFSRSRGDPRCQSTNRTPVSHINQSFSDAHYPALSSATPSELCFDILSMSNVERVEILPPNYLDELFLQADSKDDCGRRLYLLWMSQWHIQPTKTTKLKNGPRELRHRDINVGLVVLAIIGIFNQQRPRGAKP